MIAAPAPAGEGDCDILSTARGHGPDYYSSKICHAGNQQHQAKLFKVFLECIFLHSHISAAIFTLSGRTCKFIFELLLQDAFYKVVFNLELVYLLVHLVQPPVEEGEAGPHEGGQAEDDQQGRPQDEHRVVQLHLGLLLCRERNCPIVFEVDTQIKFGVLDGHTST